MKLKTMLILGLMAFISGIIGVNRNFIIASGGIGEFEIEKPNSPANNPAMYENVMLETGEWVYEETDFSIPGRGFDFNKYGQLERVTDPLGSVDEYLYYPENVPAGNGIVTHNFGTLNTTTGGYLHQVIIDKGKDHITQTFEYDSLGNVTSREDGEKGTTLYEYQGAQGHENPFGEISRIIEGATMSEDGQPAVNFNTDFKYDENGNLTWRLSGGVTTTYTYDRLNRLGTVTSKGGPVGEESRQTYMYIFDNNSNLTGIIYPKGNQDTFVYDDRDLLKTKILGNGLTTEIKLA